MRPTNNKRSRLQENKAARDYGGNRTPASGATWHSKADVKSDTFLIECKTTTKASYSLKGADLQKLWDQALIEDKIPLFEIEYSELGITTVAVDKDDLMAVFDELKLLRRENKRE